MQTTKTGFSVFLIRSSAVAEVERELFKNGKPLRGGLDGVFAEIPASRKAPTWLDAIKPYLDGRDVPKLFVESPAGLLLIRRPGSGTYLISFGHAWQRIKPKWQEVGFGRRVALNAVSPGKVLELAFQQVFTKKHVARERSPEPTDIQDFGIEYDRDLLGALEGVPSKDILGGSVRGSNSLRLSLDFSTIGKALDEAGSLYASQKYKRGYPEVDNLSPVSDQSTISQLDGLLDADLISGKARSSTSLFSPAMLRGEEQVGTSYGYGRFSEGMPKAPFLLFGSWENQLKRKNATPSLAKAKSSSIHLFDESGDVLTRFSVYECLSFEASSNGEQYFLSAGTWYRGKMNFVKQVNNTLKGIKEPSVKAPDRKGGEDEPAYNKRSCKGGKFLYFDAKTIPFAQRYSKFEFCDFLHLDKKVLYFAKISSRSSGCSHLVEQVRRTDELLFSPDPAFRKALKEAFKKHHPTADRNWLDRRPNRGDWNLCVVSMGTEKMKLPFFAKCSMARLARQMELQGNNFFFQSV